MHTTDAAILAFARANPDLVRPELTAYFEARQELSGRPGTTGPGGVPWTGPSSTATATARPSTTTR